MPLYLVNQTWTPVKYLSPNHWLKLTVTSDCIRPDAVLNGVCTATRLYTSLGTPGVRLTVDSVEVILGEATLLRPCRVTGCQMADTGQELPSCPIAVDVTVSR